MEVAGGGLGSDRRVPGGWGSLRGRERTGSPERDCTWAVRPWVRGRWLTQDRAGWAEGKQGVSRALDAGPVLGQDPVGGVQVWVELSGRASWKVVGSGSSAGNI